MSPRLFAIGGGELRLLETLAIDREIVRATGKERPNALFIGTASGDSFTYFEIFQQVYGTRLGCDTLRLIVGEGIERKLLDWADLVYVGGGNTMRMIDLWRAHGVDELLRRRFDDGMVIGGLSAGANCWFRYYNTDSPTFEGAAPGTTIRADGLGWFEFSLCPHFLREPFRREAFIEMMKSTPGMGIAVDDGAAVEFRPGEFRVLTTNPDASATTFQFADGRLIETRLKVADWFPFSELSKEGT
ncbi:MAG: peptidase E [Fimbriimonadaceae bacterium]|nr:peptidase E [Fimbriimonadaceae bacterium]